MGSLTDFAENKMAGHLTLQAYTPTANVYLALCTADPTDAATGASMNEVANSGNYSRVQINFAAASARRVTQTGAVTFPTASGSWGTATHWVVVNSATYGAGDALAHGALNSSISPISGNTPQIASGQIYAEINSGYVSNYAANGFLDRMFRNQIFTVSATHLALVTVVITDSDTGSTITEPGAGAYARLQINANGGGGSAWDLPSGNSVTNGGTTLTFTASGGNFGTIVGSCVTDAGTTGQVLFYSNDAADQPINDGSSMNFPAGNVTFSIT